MSITGSPVALHDTTATSLTVLGQTVTPLFASVQPESNWALFDLHCPPGTGTPLHREAAEERFLVLEGQLTFTVGGETVEAGPGMSLVIPAGTPHAESNASSAPARALVLSRLGERKTAMFVALAALGRAGRLDPAGIVATCSAHGVEILPPPTEDVA